MPTIQNNAELIYIEQYKIEKKKILSAACSIRLRYIIYIKWEAIRRHFKRDDPMKYFFFSSRRAIVRSKMKQTKRILDFF